MGNTSSNTARTPKNEKQKFLAQLSQKEVERMRKFCGLTESQLCVDERQNGQRVTSYLEIEDEGARKIKPEDCKYPFENLVLEGAGFKGLAYVGVVKRLEQLKLLYNKEKNTGQIKRFAGASAGAMAAALVALGYSWKDMYTFLSEDIEDIFIYKNYCCFLPNLLRYFGWNRGTKIDEYFGEKIGAKSQQKNPDMTFYDLYKERGVELCVVVTNLNLMKSEFCHPKTTPDMPIRVALRMSMAIPGMFSAVRYDGNYNGVEDVYVDGGLLCNFPLNCYDGWFLSMKKEDSFLNRLQPLKELPTLMGKRLVKRSNDLDLITLMHRDYMIRSSHNHGKW